MSNNSSIEFRTGAKANTQAGLVNGYADLLYAMSGPGKILAIAAHNKSVDTTYFLQIFDIGADGPPAADSVPDFTPIPLEPSAAGDGGAYYESQMPREFANGCWIVVSSTQDTYTETEDGNVWITAFKG
jgi:hypothetical protein